MLTKGIQVPGNKRLFEFLQVAYDSLYHRPCDRSLVDVFGVELCSIRKIGVLAEDQMQRMPSCLLRRWRVR